MNKNDLIAYVQKQQWFSDLVDERAYRLLDELMSEDAPTTEAVLTDPSPLNTDVSNTSADTSADTSANTADAAAMAHPRRGRTVPHGDSTLTREERAAINAWLTKIGYGSRSPQRHVRSDLIKAYFDSEQ